ncbi:MAG TPA: hypothetical protein VMW52_01670 [Phycisphaerae bacterium]|nr:hypothetical protein [Phycisphaerae bacterium]
MPDPVTELIQALADAKPPVAHSSGKPAGADDGGELAKAAELIPGRSETNVADLLASDELVAFRAAYAAGRVEAQVIDQVFGIVRALLARYGLML